MNLLHLVLRISFGIVLERRTEGEFMEPVGMSLRYLYSLYSNSSKKHRELKHLCKEVKGNVWYMDEAVDSSWNKVDRPQSSCDG